MDAIKSEKKYWFFSLIGLGILAVIQTLLRLHYINMPLFTDFAVYTYIGHALGNGGLLYTDLIDNKPPAIYITYMLAEKVFGYNQTTVCLLGIVFSFVSLVFVFLLLRRLGGYIVALIGAAFWILVSSTPALQAEFPNTELFINSFILIALWSFAEYLNNKRNFLYITGIALAVASFYKMNVVFVLAALALYVMLHKPGEKTVFGQLAKEMSKLVLPSVILWGITFIYFGVQNRFDDIYNVLFKALSQYAGNIFGNEWEFVKTTWFLFIPMLKEIWILNIFSWLWIVMVFILKPAKQKLWLLYGFAGVLLVIGSLRAGSPHYFQVLLPLFCIMSALFFKDVFEQLKQRPKWTWTVLGGVLAIPIVILGYYQFNYMKINPERTAIQKYGYSPSDDRELGRILKSLTRPEETIFQWGLAPSLYFYSQRKAASGFLLNQIFYFAPHPLDRVLYAKMVEDLRSSQPVFIVFTSWTARLVDDAFFQVIKKDYTFFGLYGKYVIFERKYRLNRFENVLQQYQHPTEPADHPWEGVRLRLAAQTKQLSAFRNTNVPPKPFERDLFIPKPDSPQYESVMKGIGLYRNGDLRSAEGLLRKIAEKNTGNFAAMANLGLMYEKYGLHHLALTNYQAVAEKYGHPWIDYFQEARFSLCREAERLVQETK